MDVKDGIINKLGIRVGQLEYEKANIETMYEMLLQENEQLKQQLESQDKE